MRAVNLIPAEQRGGASVGAGRSQGAAYAILGLVAGLAIMIVLYGIARHQVTSRTSEAASISAQAQQAQSEAEQLAPYATFVTAQEQRTQQVAQIVDSRFDWAHVFHEFGRVIPSSASVTSLSGTIVPGTATSVASGPAPATSSSASSCLLLVLVRQHLGDTPWQHPDLLDRGLRQDAGRCGTAARASAPDGRRQRRDAAELDQDIRREQRERRLPPERARVLRDHHL